MYQLYYYPGNASFTPHVLLREIRADHELVFLDRQQNAHRQPEYLKLNPNGKIPTLVDGERVVYETAAICLYLAERHPEAALMPALDSPLRAKFLQWLMYFTNTIQAEMLLYFYPERLTDDDAAAGQVKQHAERRIGEMFDRVTASTALAQGGPYLLGDAYSVLDPYLLMFARWSRNMREPARSRPALADHLARVIARPAVRQAIVAENIATDTPFY